MNSSSQPPVFVVDTSVVVKWFIEREEGYQARAIQLLEAHFKGRCLLRAPEFLLLELANALTTGLRLKSERVFSLLEDFQRFSIQLLAFKWSTLVRAVEIAFACGEAVYNCYFLAAALESGGILVTADEAFLRRVGNYPGVMSIAKVRIPE